LEERIAGCVQLAPQGLTVRMAPGDSEAICSQIEDAAARYWPANRPAVALVSPRVRVALRQLTAARLPRLVVLGYGEITRDTLVESVAVVSDLDVGRRAA
jgi:flagellar biosynthesis component FlhA